jgi:hypothetical protein
MEWQNSFSLREKVTEGRMRVNGLDQALDLSIQVCFLNLQKSKTLREFLWFFLRAFA